MGIKKKCVKRHEEERVKKNIGYRMRRGGACGGRREKMKDEASMNNMEDKIRLLRESKVNETRGGRNVG